MFSEDFKSFCRAAPPSEVGSIPTRSRHIKRRATARRNSSYIRAAQATLLALAFAASLSFCQGPAHAQPTSAPDDETPPPTTAPPDTAGAIAPVPVTPPPESEPAPPDTMERQ